MRTRWMLAAVLAACSAATAAQETARFEITPLAGYRFGGTFDIDSIDAAYEMDDAASFGLILDLRESSNTQWELIFSQQQSDAQLNSALALQPTVDVDIRLLQVGGTYLGPGSRVRPYLAATIGGTRIDVDSESDTFFSGSIGVGLQILPESRVGLRVEARAHGALTSSDSDLFCRTGPDENICAVRVEGEVLGQFETFVGAVVRF